MQVINVYYLISWEQVSRQNQVLGLDVSLRCSESANYCSLSQTIARKCKFACRASMRSVAKKAPSSSAPWQCVTEAWKHE